MSKETRRDLVLTFILFLVSAAGGTSVFVGSRVLAWIAIVISDSYLAAVLLLAALRSDDDDFLDRHSWITGFFPRKTTGILVVTLLFLAIVSGFAGLYVGAEVFPSGKTPLDALYISFFILGFTDYSPAPGYGQLVVIAQLVSGVLCWLHFFPSTSHEFPLSKTHEPLFAKHMKTKEVIKAARDLAKPFRVGKGKDFRLKDADLSLG